MHNELLINSTSYEIVNVSTNPSDENDGKRGTWARVVIRKEEGLM